MGREAALPEASGRYSSTGPARYWYPLCWSRSLGTSPLALRLFDTPLVVFRDGRGLPTVLLDRCPHRNTPLSLGRCVGGELECAYHGWRFDGHGRCVAVPASLEEPSGPARDARAYPCRESQGLIWVWMQGEPDREPYAIPGVGDSRYRLIEYDGVFEATLFATAENILDVPHTSFLHKGLFRGAGTRTRITVRVTRRRDRAEAQFMGEPRPQGLIGSLLAPRGGELTHVDRFLMPGIAQVEYSLGEESHVVVTNLLSPVSQFTTSMFTVVALRLPMATRAVAAVAEPVARRIVAQDAWVLRAQTARTRELGGEQFVSTEVDVLGSSILKLLRWGEQGSVPDVPDEVREIEMEI